MIITERMRADIEYLIKKGYTKTRILNQIILDYHLTPYTANPHESIAQRKELTKQIETQQAKHGGRC